MQLRPATPEPILDTNGAESNLYIQHFSYLFQLFLSKAEFPDGLYEKKCMISATPGAFDSEL
jgi:hypothetical protein